ADGLADHEVLLEALGGALGDVRDLAQRRVTGGERLAGLGLEPLHIGRELLHLGQQRLLLLALGLRDLLAEGLLLGARGLEGRSLLAPQDVGLEDRVDGGGVAPPCPLGVTDGLRVLAQLPQIDHCSRVPGPRPADILRSWTSPCSSSASSRWSPPWWRSSCWQWSWAVSAATARSSPSCARTRSAVRAQKAGPTTGQTRPTGLPAPVRTPPSRPTTGCAGSPWC